MLVRIWRTKNSHTSFAPPLGGQFGNNSAVEDAYVPQHGSSTPYVWCVLRTHCKLFDTPLIQRWGLCFFPWKMSWSVTASISEFSESDVIWWKRPHSSALLAGMLTPGAPSLHTRSLTTLQPLCGREQRYVLQRTAFRPSLPNHLPGHLRVTPPSDSGQCHVVLEHLPAEPCPKFLHTALWGITKCCCFKLRSFGIICYAATDNWNHIQQKSMHMCTKRYVQKCLLYHCLQKQTIGNNLNLHQEKNKIFKIMICSYNGVHFSSENEWIGTTCVDVTISKQHWAQKQVAEGYVQLGSIYMQNSTILCLWMLIYIGKIQPHAREWRTADSLWWRWDEEGPTGSFNVLGCFISLKKIWNKYENMFGYDKAEKRGPAGGYSKYVTTAKTVAPRRAPLPAPGLGSNRLSCQMAEMSRKVQRRSLSFGELDSPRARDSSCSPVCLNIG